LFQENEMLKAFRQSKWWSQLTKVNNPGAN